MFTITPGSSEQLELPGGSVTCDTRRICHGNLNDKAGNCKPHLSVCSPKDFTRSMILWCPFPVRDHLPADYDHDISKDLAGDDTFGRQHAALISLMKQKVTGDCFCAISTLERTNIMDVWKYRSLDC